MNIFRMIDMHDTKDGVLIDMKYEIVDGLEKVIDINIRNIINNIVVLYNSMGFWSDAYNWVKGAVSDVADVAGKVLPVATALGFLKAGGKVKEVADTPANRRKFLSIINKHHGTKISMKMFNEIIASKGGKKLKLASK